ncbi:MAG: hypothetical protein ACYS9X_26390 [Planctomycetota bacterium]|jgi:sialate O-acetylesterase
MMTRAHLGQCALALAAAIFLAAAAGAEVRLAGAFGENCVLQRDTKVPVWGTAAPAERVTVTFAGQTRSAEADAFGRWRVELGAMPASAEGRPLAARGREGEARVAPVYVGDVWLYLSQSWHLGGPKDLRLDSATLPPICANAADVWEHRNHSRRPEVRRDQNPRWTAYKTPGRYYRNDAYYLGIGLARATRAPVGVVGLGASTLESMTPAEGFLALEEELGATARAVAEWSPGTPRGREAYLKSLAEIGRWVDRARATCERAGATHEDFTQPPALPGPPALGRGPTTLYNRVAHRFMSAAMRGIIVQPKLYNVGDREYAVKARALVLGLRAACGREDIPVCFVQMHAPGRYEVRETEDQLDWIRMREAQNELARIPRTTVLATYDLKSTSRSEPDIGLRVADWAAAVVRGAAVRSGPRYERHRVDGASIVVDFADVGRGLMAGEARTGEPVREAEGARVGGFEIAGPDGFWREAEASVRGEAVIVTREGIARPVAVRYAWSPGPSAANLYNRDGFPALPFETR